MTAADAIRSERNEDVSTGRSLILLVSRVGAWRYLLQQTHSLLLVYDSPPPTAHCALEGPHSPGHCERKLPHQFLRRTNIVRKFNRIATRFVDGV